MRSCFLRVFAFFICAAMLLGLCACAPDYTGDGRLGSYTDLETGAYTLTLRADGRGTVRHTSVLGTVTEEDIVFELDGAYIDILGKTASGGVIGRNEYSGTVEEKDGGYAFALKSVETGVLLGTFVKTGS